MIGEKDKQIKETQAKFAASEAYALRERLQESMEALQVAANLQAEQLQYLEDNALKKLDAMDDQIVDVQDDLDVKCAHHGQLKDVLRAYLEKGDDTLVPILVSLAGFSHAEATAMREERARRESRTVAGVAARFGRLGFKLGGATMEKLISACAPPRGEYPRKAPSSHPRSRRDRTSKPSSPKPQPRRRRVRVRRRRRLRPRSRRPRLAVARTRTRTEATTATETRPPRRPRRRKCHVPSPRRVPPRVRSRPPRPK